MVFSRYCSRAWGCLVSRGFGVFVVLFVAQFVVCHPFARCSVSDLDLCLVPAALCSGC